MLDHEETVLLTVLVLCQHPAFQEQDYLLPLINVAAKIRGQMSHADVARLCLKLSLAHAKFHKDDSANEIVAMTDILKRIIKVDTDASDDHDTSEDWKH